ncbi:hypothetical protein BE17_51125 [Sorangium cellulosum]|uniref:Uncharacterized protein n=1 Tax=Sorangium cellulosum TaxID=56 RepID=A0A150R7A5_SORCE|nr:hypothetical protein BE17_51125 [Sorangium cellulosum]
MPNVQKRTVLEHLARDQLISIADAFDVHVPDRHRRCCGIEEHRRGRDRAWIRTSTALPV